MRSGGDPLERSLSVLLSEVPSSPLPSEYAQSYGLVWRRLPRHVSDTAPEATTGLV